MIAYISGAYSADTKEGVEQNIRESERVAKELWSARITALSPHMNTAHFQIEGVTYDDYIKGDLEMLARCDAVVMLPNWFSSPGAMAEKVFAKNLGMPIYYYPDIPVRSVEMSPAQERHLARIIYRFTQDVSAKYRAGQAEHGGNLFDKPNLQMLMEEVQDLVVYAYTLKDQIHEAINLDRSGYDEGIANILEYGNKDGKIIKDIDKE